MKNKVILVFVLIILLISLCIVSNAAVSSTDLKVEANVSGDQLQEVVIPIFITDSAEKVDETVGYQATLEYDDEIFDMATFEAENNWNGTYNDVTKKIIQDTSNAIKDQEIGKLTLRLKKYTTDVDTVIKIKDIKIATDTEFIEPEEKVSTVQIKAKEEPVLASGTQTSSINAENTAQTKADGTTASTIIPNAGIETFLVILIVITIILIIFFKFKSRKIK